MSENVNYRSCYFFGEDNDMGARTYSCNYPEEVKFGDCPCMEGKPCLHFISRSDVKKMARKCVDNRVPCKTYFSSDNDNYIGYDLSKRIDYLKKGVNNDSSVQ